MGAPPVTPARAAAPPPDIQTAPPLVGFSLRDIPPTAPIYVQQNDFLQFFFFSNTNNSPITVKYRLLTPDGQIREGTLNGVFTGGFPVLNIGPIEGWLLSFTVNANAGMPAGAWMFVQAVLGRALTGQAILQTYGVIWEGYAFSASVTGWPGTPAQRIKEGVGQLRSIVGTTPAAGADISEVVPNKTRWQLISMRAVLTTSAAVANRFPALSLDDGVNSYYLMGTSTAQAASLVGTYLFASGVQFFNDTQGRTSIPMPSPLTLQAGFRIRTLTGGIQAADQWANPVYTVLEWGDWES